MTKGDLPRVLLLTDADVFAGTERHMLDLAGALADLGVPVRVGCPAPSPLAEKVGMRGIEVVAIPKRGMVDFAAVKRIAGMLRSGEIDIVHAHNGRTHLAAALAVSRAGRGACVATQHFLFPSRVGRRGPKAWLSAAAHRWTTHRTARIVAISDAVKRAALARRDATQQQLHTVLNGMMAPDPAALRPAAAIRADLGLPADAPFIFCAARLEQEKDVPTLIDAMKPVAAAFPAVHCFIAGSGQERASIEAQIARHGLSPHVHLLGFRDDVLSLIRAADIFVLPSAVEGFGLVVLEAMALGVPVIAINAGGPCEIVEPGVTGLLTPPKDSHQLASALQQLLTDPPLRQRFGSAGAERFRQHFTAARMACETLAVYNAALGQGGNS